MSKEVTDNTAGIRLYTFDDAETIIDNETYTISDLAIKDSRGRIGFTISITRLKRGQQTRGHDHPEWEVYEFFEGTGILMIDAKAMSVKAGDSILIEGGRFHKAINISHATDLVFRCYAVGKIKRPHLAVRQ